MIKNVANSIIPKFSKVFEPRIIGYDFIPKLNAKISELKADKFSSTVPKFSKVIEPNIVGYDFIPKLNVKISELKK